MSSIPQNTALLHSVIAAGLSDPDIKAAVLEYLKAETEKVKPKQDWREIWHQLSDDVRRYVQSGIDPVTGLNNKTDNVQLYLSAWYHDIQGVVKIYAEMILAGKERYHYWHPIWDRHYQINENPTIWQKVLNASDYTVAILSAQAAWTDALEWFMQQTEAVSDDE